MANLESSTGLSMKVHLVESSGAEFGFGRSMNAGIKAAGPSEFLIGMDSDAFPRPGALDKLIACCQEDPRLGYVGVKILAPNARPNVAWVDYGPIGYTISCLRAKAPFHAVRRLLKGNWWALGPGIVSEHKPGKMVGFASTTFILRRECYEDVGPFDEGYRVSYADVDFAFRVLTSGRWFMTSCPEAEVLHEYHATRTRKNDMEEFEGLHRFCETWSKERMRAVRRAAREGKFVSSR